MSYRPSAEHRALLRAALGPDPEAVAAWSAWRAERRLDDVPPEVVRALPAIAARLAPARPDDAELASVHAARRLAWADNARRAARSAVVAAELGARGIDAVFFKGLGVLPFWADPTARRMGDADLLVRWPQRSEAIAALAALGFRPVQGMTIAQVEGVARTLPGYGFRRDDGLELDLHWRPLHHLRPTPHVDDVVFAAAVTRTVGPVELRVASAGHELVLVLGHGLRADSGARLVALLDAAELLAAPELEVAQAEDLARSYERASAVVAGCEAVLDAIGARERSDERASVVADRARALARSLGRRPIGDRLLDRQLLAEPGAPERRATLARDGWVALTTPLRQGAAIGGLAELARTRAELARVRDLPAELVWRASGHAPWAHRFRRVPVGAPADPPWVHVGDVLQVGVAETTVDLLESGWWAPEGHHVWTRGPVSVLAFVLRLEGAAGCRLRLRLQALAGLEATQRVEVRLNGRRRATLQLDPTVPDPQWFDLPVAVADLPEDGRCELVLLVPDRGVPRRLRGIADDREVGVALSTLRIDAAG